jgi:glycosyltransferase involved in cell wall biosynthesis
MNPRSGGAEIHLHEVFGRLARRGHEVTLLVSGWKGASSRERLDDMDVHRVGTRHTYNAIAPFYYRRQLKSRRFDVFVEDLNKVPIFAPFWAGSPVALLVHHLFGATAFQEAAFPIAALTWLLERPLARTYPGIPVVAVSRSTEEDLVARGFERGHIRVIENGVDAQRYRPDPAQPRFGQPTILYLGRLQRYKRVDLILEAFARMAPRNPDARLVIAGTGTAAADLGQLVARLGLEQRVELPGFVSEAEKLRLLRGAWVHVLTSPKEGWGIANLEAAACGTATVASDSPGLRDSVRHGQTGFLVPHGDVDALSERLQAVLADPALRENLGRNARQFAEELSWERAADRMEAFLAEVAGQRVFRVHQGREHGGQD